MKKFEEFLFETKLGYFLFIVVFGTLFAVVMGAIVALITEHNFWFGFITIFCGMFFSAIVMTIFKDDIEKWI